MDSTRQGAVPVRIDRQRSSVKLAIYLRHIWQSVPDDFRRVMDVIERSDPSKCEWQVTRGCGVSILCAEARAPLELEKMEAVDGSSGECLLQWSTEFYRPNLRLLKSKVRHLNSSVHNSSEKRNLCWRANVGRYSLPGGRRLYGSTTFCFIFGVRGLSGHLNFRWLQISFLCSFLLRCASSLRRGEPCLKP